MNRIFQYLVAMLLIQSLGCVTPQNTRFPTLGFNDPEISRREIEQFDPLPQEDIGPGTQARQRDSATTRTYTRRNQENSLRANTPLVPGIDPFPEQSSAAPAPTYPEAVRN